MSIVDKNIPEGNDEGKTISETKLIEKENKKGYAWWQWLALIAAGYAVLTQNLSFGEICVMILALFLIGFR